MARLPASDTATRPEALLSANPVPLDSYGGFRDGCGVRETISGRDALADRLAAARLRGERLTARATGLSFQDHAQGDIVLDLAALGGPLDVDGDTLRAGASASLRQVLDAAVAGGAIVPVLPTCSHISLGGSIASAGISRASTACGRSSDGVLAMTLLTPDGQLRTVRCPGPDVPVDEATLFRAVAGGFGGLGIVLDLRLRLQRLPWPGAPRVETVGRALSHPSDAVEPLLAALRVPAPDPSAPWRGHRDPTVSTPWATLHTEKRVLALTQRLVSPDTPHAPFSLHSPERIWNHLGQWATAVNPLAALLPDLLYAIVRRHEAPFVDRLHDAWFMMDGNYIAQRFARRWGVPMGVIQQSYALPVGPGATDATPTLRFLEAMFRRLRDAGLAASVIDLLALPADDALLSACATGPCVVVTVAFQHFGGARAARGAIVLEALAEDTLALGGRVHLVKHVFAPTEVLRAMYGDALREWTAVRDRYDPERILSSRFLDRLAAAAGEQR